MLSHPVDLFLHPKRIALIGVSTNASSITARPAHYLRKYGSPSEVTVVRQDGLTELHGLPVVPSLQDFDNVPDVAMVMVPAASVADVLDQCASVGIKGAVVISSGFEGEKGIGRRREVEAVLTKHPDFRLVGPNCVGVLSPVEACWLTFSSVLQDQRPINGRVGLVTQSGAVGNGLLLALQERGAGLAHWFSTGDELDVGTLEVATGLLRREDCSAVGLFLEGISDPEHRDALAEAIESTGKRVIAVRAAASEQGKRAAMGHTGRVVGRDEIARAALEEIGVLIVDGLDELTDTLTLLSVAPPPPEHTARTAIVTVSGATGVMAADEVARHPSLSLASFGDETIQSVMEATGTLDASDIANPLDVPVLGDPTVFERAIEAVANSDEADATIAIVSTLAHDYQGLSRSLDPDGNFIVLAHLSPVERFTPSQARRLAERGVALVRAPRSAVRALSVWASTSIASQPASSGPAATRRQLGLSESASRLGQQLGRWLAPSRIVHDSEEAVAFLEQHEQAGIVLKADGQAIEHRADIGAVETGLTDSRMIETAFERIAAICKAHEDHVIAQAMAPPGIEVMVSVLRDPEVGTAALLRPGGGLVELGANSVVLTDARRYWAAKIGDSILGSILGGWRGSQPHDLSALMDLTADLMRAVTDDADMKLAECNPVIVHPRGARRGATIVDLITYLDPQE